MKKRIWDLYAPVYEKAMRADAKTYGFMYRHIPKIIEGKEVLEIATGPGLLAKHVAASAAHMIATDYSEGMIWEARKGVYPPNLHFEVADATCLPYADNAFDVVIIANALHVMPDPGKALAEIHRVLRPDGILIAPNFVNHSGSFGSRLWSGILRLAGISFQHRWTPKEYVAFLAEHHWKVIHGKLLGGRIPELYTECVWRETAGAGTKKRP